MKTKTPAAAERTNARKTIWVFTPSRTDPKDLEFILVQRQKLLQDAVERVRESALTEHKHHLLFVGPRGCGKTHLVTLIVSRLSEDDALTDRLRIAWLNEDETCTTLLELLLKIHAALEKRYPAEYRADMLGTAYDMKQDAAQEFMGRHILASLGTRTLLVVAENLDAIFDGLGAAGQMQLRAFIQENPKLSIVATAQRLVEDLSDRTSPFFGFFQTEHLKPLNVEEATELLQNIARLHDNRDVVEFLATSRGRSRVRALHHLSGGNHRIYIVLSQFITRDTMDGLLGPFMKMVDELTPYYQERVRWLPPMQRKIVEYLCSCEGTVPVKEIAKRLFATPQTISSQLQDLREKGYVEANQRGRESLYEISEPLMRICVEVKENQGHQPLRLLVDFLRVWYDDKDLNHRLGKLEPGSVSRAYLQAALQRNKDAGNLRMKLLLEDLGFAQRDEMSAQWLNDISSRVSEGLLVSVQLAKDGNKTEALKCLNEVLSEVTNHSNKAELLCSRGMLHSELGQPEKSIEDYTAAIGLSGAPVKLIAGALYYRGNTHLKQGDRAAAIADYTRAIELPDVPSEQVAMALVNRGFTHGKQGDSAAEITDYTRAIELHGAPPEQIAKAFFNRGVTHGQRGDNAAAIGDYTCAIELPGAPPEEVAAALRNRAITHGRQGDNAAEIADYTRAIELPGTPIPQVAAARCSRGRIYWESGDTKRALEDFTAVIHLTDAPVVLVHVARMIRGITYGQTSEPQRAIEDFTAVIGIAGVEIEVSAISLYWRGVNFFQQGKKHEAQADFEMLVRLPDAPTSNVVDAYLALAEIHWSDGLWMEGFAALEACLQRGSKEQPPYQEKATDLLGVLFSAGLNPKGRLAKVTDLLGIYAKYQALPVLGEAVVQHIGKVFRAGEPLPSADNLEQWASAWEQAAESVPEFRLSVRLLRTGANFVKAGGKDPGILLDLTSPERAILQQALGLAEKEQTKPD